MRGGGLRHRERDQRENSGGAPPLASHRLRPQSPVPTARQPSSGVTPEVHLTSHRRPRAGAFESATLASRLAPPDILVPQPRCRNNPENEFDGYVDGLDNFASCDAIGRYPALFSTKFNRNVVKRFSISRRGDSSVRVRITSKTAAYASIASRASSRFFSTLLVSGLATRPMPSHALAASRLMTHASRSDADSAASGMDCGPAAPEPGWPEDPEGASPEASGFV